MRSNTLVNTVGAVAAAALVGGLASRPAQSTWYAGLKKPTFQPPPRAFSIVWPVLYADIAVVSAATLDHLQTRDRRQARSYAALLGANLILNSSWTWLFFTRRRLGASVAAAAALTVSGADLTRRAVTARGPSAGILGLYSAWCAFATLLSARIWRLNRST
jgi:tryptophan-rich sensory protein